MLRGTLTKKSRLLIYQTTEADFDDFRLDFLGEFEAIFETDLAHE
jgi:hypothetical protein